MNFGYSQNKKGVKKRVIPASFVVYVLKKKPSLKNREGQYYELFVTTFAFN
jgi:hypothetical protein